MASVVLAVNEAVANAIEHGYASDGTGLVEVRARVAEDGLVVRSATRATGSTGRRRRCAATACR